MELSIARGRWLFYRLFQGKVNRFAHRLEQDWFRSFEWEWLNGARWNFNRRVLYAVRKRKESLSKRTNSFILRPESAPKRKSCTAARRAVFIINKRRLPDVDAYSRPRRERVRARFTHYRLLWWTTSTVSLYSRRIQSRQALHDWIGGMLQAAGQARAPQISYALMNLARVFWTLIL